MMKSRAIAKKLDNVLAEAGHLPLMESRRLKPALIYMRRGTFIPAHHVREARSPNSGEVWVIAGIDPGRWESYNNGLAWYKKMRDFWPIVEWVPNRGLVERGFQDETGWSEPDSGGRYNAQRELRMVRNFKKILTMKRDNVQVLEYLEPGTDLTPFQYKAYDDNAKNRIRGNRLD